MPMDTAYCRLCGVPVLSSINIMKQGVQLHTSSAVGIPTNYELQIKCPFDGGYHKVPVPGVRYVTMSHTRFD
jgi:hypothetical protein